MPSNHLYEHKLAQFRENAFTAGALVGRLHHRLTDHLANPACVAILWISSLDHRRQVFEKGIERLSIAGQEAADKLGRGRPVAPKVDEERQLAASGCVNHAGGERIGAHARAA